MKIPLVSILIPAYNAEESISESIQSAIAQTWKRKEIIVVNDGSTDRTAELARRFASKEVAVLSTANHGLSATVNHAFRLSQGDFIQELDADDLLAPDKIERQIAALREVDSRRTLLSSAWAYFYFRPQQARFVATSLCRDLSPVEWLLAKMGENLHMQNATWLMSRELAEAAGPWDERLHYDQDGEYFARVLMASQGTHFVPEARIYYRVGGMSRISYVGNSDKKKDSLLISMKLHIEYLRSLEDSERVQKACLVYLQNWYHHFYPSRPDIVAQVQSMAAQCQGRLEVPRLKMKYAWMKPILGEKAARHVEMVLPQLKSSLLRSWDKTMYRIQTRSAVPSRATNAVNLSRGLHR